METDESPKPKRMHFATVLFLSFLIVVVGMVIEQTVSWTNHFDGLMSGLIQGLIMGVAFCLIYVLPWSLIIIGINRWRGCQRFQTLWLLGPSILLAVLLISSLIFSPPIPSKRFKNFTKTEFPRNAQDVHYRFSGGGFADNLDIYYLKTTPSEVDRLIANLGLEENKSYSQKDISHPMMKPLPGCPDFKLWEGSREFKGWDQRQHWFYTLITDSTRTHVYLMVGCI